MKTFITTIIIASMFAAELFSNNNQKFYEITDNGQFRFMYWMEQDADNSKGGIKPVTERTFYLETARQGLLPQGLTYYDFIQLTIEEKQAILRNSQFGIISAMENRNALTPLNPVSVTATHAEPVITIMEDQLTDELGQIAEPDMIAPWLVKAITRPGTEHDLPTDLMPLDNEIALNNDLPWAVDVILNEAQQTNEKQMASIIKTVSTLTSSR